MSSEQNLPEVPVQQGPPTSQGSESFTESSIPHGMGQSKSSRRRRRKRKTKGDDFSPETTAGAGEDIISLQAVHAPSQSAPLQASAAPSNQGQSISHGGGQNSQAAGAKRWKKKFRDRDRGGRPSDNPGNQATANFSPSTQQQHGPRDTNTHQFGNRADGFKRKSSNAGGKGQRDRGPRSFVGPMDHSYRVVNGNFADAPPSTIETGGGGYQGRSRSYHSNGDSQPIDYSQGKTVPIPDDAPTRIYFFVEDLFIVAKITETARKIGVKVGFVKNEKEVIAEMLAVEEDARPGLIVFDLNNANAKPLTLVPKLKTKFKRSTSIIGFLSHLQGDLKAKATEAGCDTVMPRAAFSQNLPNLLRRYGLHEEPEENNFNY